MLLCTNITYQKNLLFKEALEMMIINSNIFSWSEFVRLRDSNKTLIVFKLFTEYFRLWKIYIEYKDNFFISTIKYITLRIAYLNVIYYASVVLRANYFCNLLHHNTWHPTYVITYPVRDMIFSLLSKSAWSHPQENWHLLNTQ